MDVEDLVDDLGRGVDLVGQEMRVVEIRNKHLVGVLVEEEMEGGDVSEVTSACHHQSRCYEELL